MRALYRNYQGTVKKCGGEVAVPRTKQKNNRFLILAVTVGLLLSAALGYGLWYAFAGSHAVEISSKNKKAVPTRDAVPSSRAVSASQSALSLFAQQLSPGKVFWQQLVSEQRVSLSTTIAKSGEASLRGKGLSDGLFLYLNKVNTEYGGLGKAIPIALDQRDDSGVLLKTISHINELMPTSSLFFSPMGDHALEKAYLPLIHAHKAAALFPISGLRPAVNSAPLIFMRPSYDQEVAALVHYATTLLKKTKIAVFHEESSWGRAGMRAVERLLAQHKLQLCAAASYQPGTVNIESALALMQRAEPHVIICIANGRPAYNFIREAVNKSLHYVSFLGTSQLAGIAQHLFDSRGISMITSSVVPNPHNSQLPIAQEYRQDMQKYLPNKGLSTYSLEGYINSMLLTYFLQQLPSNATVRDLFESIRQTRDLTFKGMRLGCFQNTLSHTVWINEGMSSTWQEYKVRQ